MEEGTEGEEKREERRMALSCYRSRNWMSKANCNINCNIS